MRRVGPTPSAVLMTTALAIVGLLIAPVGVLGALPASPALPGHGTGSSLSHATGAPAAAHPQTGRPALNVPAGGRVYQTSSSAISGDSQQGRIAADPANGTVYSISTTSSLLTAYNGISGLRLRATQLSNDTTLSLGLDIALDNRSGNLYVGLATETGTGYIEVVQASTFSVGTNISFASSGVPTFHPYRLLYESRTNQLLAENQSNNDVFAVNVTTNAAETFISVPCSGYAPYGCSSQLDMFDANLTVGWYAVVPSGSSYCWSIYLAANPASDLLAGGFNGTSLGFLLGPGTYSVATNFIYFMNDTGDGTVAAYYPNGTQSGWVRTGTGTAYALVTDPATGWLVLSTFTGAGFGDQVDLLDPLSGAVVAGTSNASLPDGYVVTDVVVFDAPNGTGYVTTSGQFNAFGSELIHLTGGSPYAVVVTTYPGVAQALADLAADPATGLVYEISESPNGLLAVTETTGAIAWSIPTPGGIVPEWVTVDASDAIVYLAGASDVWAISATNGALLGTLATPAFSPYYDAYGFGHLLYLTDVTNSTIQVYSTAGAPGSFTWTATIQLTSASDPCSLSASPVAEYVVDLACGLSHNLAQINSVASKGTIANVTGSPNGYAAEFNATGALFVGNDTPGHYGVQVFAAGSWTPVRFLPSPVAVETLDLDPVVNGVLVANYSGSPSAPVALLNATTGGLEATFHLPGAVEFPAVDPTSGAIAVTTGAGQSFLANLVALPSAVSGLAAHAGNATLNATWSAATGPTGFPVTGYSVSTATSASGPWTTAGASSTTSFTVTGLTDGTTYFVTVRATGSSGTGPSVPAVSAVPIGVPFPPSVVTTSGATTSAITVGWQAPANDGGVAVSGYTVLDAKSAGGPWTSVANTTGTSATVSSLSTGTTYYFVVEASNSVGTSHPSASTSGATTSNSGLFGLGSGGTLLVVGIAVVVVLIGIGLAALMMMRRRGGSGSGPGTPPSGATGDPSSPPPPGA